MQSQAIEPLYVIDPKNFKGTIQSTMRNGKVDYTNGLTLDEYNKETGKEFIALEWGEFEEKYQKPYLKSLCKKFNRITKKQFWYYLECVPPKKYKNIGGFLTFFVGECYTATLYEFCFEYQGKYWSALRDIYTSEADLLEEMKRTVEI